jgi:hypothetical protein
MLRLNNDSVKLLNCLIYEVIMILYSENRYEIQVVSLTICTLYIRSIYNMLSSSKHVPMKRQYLIVILILIFTYQLIVIMNYYDILIKL